MSLVGNFRENHGYYLTSQCWILEVMFEVLFLRKVEKGLITLLFISVIQHIFLNFFFTRIKVGLIHRTVLHPTTLRHGIQMTS
jgi:hypothetical protein